ncbi:MAG: hypothetical protein H6752_07975 [Candidatus Omnitrophica bacterium]|nr:hypothetical protein [Candidatus Omnitrophota bacterium]
MDLKNVKRKFEAMGASLSLPGAPQTPRWSRVPPYTLDINEGRGGNDRFELRVSPEADGELEITVPHIDKEARHLVLAVRQDRDTEQFLCGHDERHWFVAALPRNVRNVSEALESLKPEEAVVSQERKKVRGKRRNNRRNAGFIRQGEWFFIPAPEMEERKGLIVFKNEPLRRGNGKPHTAQFLTRTDGVTVYVCRKFPNGLAYKEYKRYTEDHPEERNLFQMMTRDATVYVKGRISHPDHKTVVLDTWHRVMPNTEARSAQVVFLD